MAIGRTLIRSHLEFMTNLIIGLGVGMAAAVILGVMWRMADRLREEIETEANEQG